jgi:O-antigen ligase
MRQKIHNVAGRVTNWAVPLLALSIPISVALDNLLSLILLLLVLASFSFTDLLQITRTNPVVRAGLLLFAGLLFGSLYGNASLDVAFGTLGKYFDLVLLLVFVPLFRDENIRKQAMSAYMAAMLLTLLLSLLLGFGAIQGQEWMWSGGLDDRTAIFRSPITQSILMAFTVYVALLKFFDTHVIWKRFLLAAFVFLGCVNVLAYLGGRTGVVVLGILLVRAAWLGIRNSFAHKFNTPALQRGAMVVVALSLIGVAGLTYSFSPRFSARVDRAITEFHAWQPGRYEDTSVGKRLDYYYNTLIIIRDHPLTGVGTGGFPDAFAKQVVGTGIDPTDNPHNEYLMVAAQTGLFGLALLLYFLAVQWRYAAQLESPFARDAARGLVLTVAVSCLFNSSLLDHTEGLFFAFMSALLFANLKVERKHG